MRAFEASSMCLFEEQHLLCACSFTYVKIKKKEKNFKRLVAISSRVIC